MSLDKSKLIIPELKPSNGYFSYSKTTQGSTYASSTDNIARLLKGWVKKTPKLEQAHSSSVNETTTSSEGDQSGPKSEGVDLSEAFESIFGFESFESSNSEFSQSMSPEASPFQDERKPDVGDQFPLSMLENWLFDEGLVHGKEELADFSFDINAEMFV